MKYFGTVKSFDTTLGHGEISPEVAGNPLRFEVRGMAGIDVPFNKVQELRSLGFRTVTLKNIDTHEEITDVESLVRDSPEA